MKYPKGYYLVKAEETPAVELRRPVGQSQSSGDGAVDYGWKTKVF